MNLELLKQALRVDYDDDDKLIQLLQDGAAVYIEKATGAEYDETDPQHEILMIALVEEAFRNRSYTIEGKSNNVRSMIKSIVLQQDWGSEI